MKSYNISVPARCLKPIFWPLKWVMKPENASICYHSTSIVLVQYMYRYCSQYLPNLQPPNLCKYICNPYSSTYLSLTDARKIRTYVLVRTCRPGALSNLKVWRNFWPGHPCTLEAQPITTHPKPSLICLVQPPAFNLLPVAQQPVEISLPIASPQ